MVEDYPKTDNAGDDVDPVHFLRAMLAISPDDAAQARRDARSHDEPQADVEDADKPD